MPKAPKTTYTLAQLQAALAALTPKQKAAFLKTLREPSMQGSPLARHLTTLTPAQQKAFLDALAENLPPVLREDNPYAIEQLTEVDLQAGKDPSEE